MASTSLIIQVQAKGKAEVEALTSAVSKLPGVTDKTKKPVEGLDKATDSLGKTFKRTLAFLRNLLAGFTATATLSKFGKTIGEFEQTMAKISAISGIKKTSMEFMQLTEVARELGATTKFTAAQAAEGLLYLAKTGYNTREQMDAIRPVLHLASTELMDFGHTADLVTNITRQFNLSAKDTTKVVDTLLTTANNTNVSVEQLAEGMKFVGPVAASMGMSLSEASAALGVLGNAGIQGSLAGVQLRAVLTSLLGPTLGASKRFREMGLEISETNLAHNDALSVLELLGKSYMSTQDAVEIFTRRASAGALVLSKNTELMKELIIKNEAANDAAERQARIIDDTLLGSVRSLNSAFEELILQGGDRGALGFFRSIIDGTTNTIRSLVGMRDSIKGNIGLFDKLADATKALGVAMATYIGFSALSRIVSGLHALFTASATLATGFGALAPVITLAAGALAFFIQKSTVAKNAAVSQAKIYDQLKISLQGYTDALILEKEASTESEKLASLYNRAEIMRELTKFATIQVEKQKELNRATNSTIKLMNYRIKESGGYGGSMGLAKLFTSENDSIISGEKLNELKKEYGKALDDLNIEYLSKVKILEKNVTGSFENMCRGAAGAGTAPAQTLSEYYGRTEDIINLLKNSNTQMVLGGKAFQGPVQDIYVLNDAYKQLQETTDKAINLSTIKASSSELSEVLQKEYRELSKTELSYTRSGLAKQIQDARNRAMSEFEGQTIGFLDTVNELTRNIVNTSEQNITGITGVFSTESQNLIKKQFDDAKKTAITQYEAYVAELSEKFKNTDDYKKMTATEQEQFNAAMQADVLKYAESISKSREFLAPTLGALTDEEVKYIQVLKDMNVSLADRNAILKLYNEARLNGQVITEGEIRAAGEVYKRQEETNRLLQKQEQLANGVGDAFGGAFEDMIMGAKDFSAAIKDLTADIARLAVQYSITEPLARAISTGVMGFFGGGNPTAATDSQYFNMNSGGGANYSDFALPYEYAKGGAFYQGHTMRFANGGVINKPTRFNMGLMGEAGPEAIMPLTRASNGELGIKAQSQKAMSPNVQLNVVNNSNSQVQASNVKTSFDSKGIVLDVLLEDFNTNGPIKQMMSSSRR